MVYPQSERMFEYTLDENESDAHVLKESEKDYTPRAIVGIRPCDAHGFDIVKINFDNAEYRDPWWVKRFESTTLVGIGCGEPCSTCFCTQVGGGPFNDKHLDVLLYDLGDQFLAKALTEKGEGVLREGRRRRPCRSNGPKESCSNWRKQHRKRSPKRFPRIS